MTIGNVRDAIKDELPNRKRFHQIKIEGNFSLEGYFNLVQPSNLSALIYTSSRLTDALQLCDCQIQFDPSLIAPSPQAEYPTSLTLVNTVFQNLAGFFNITKAKTTLKSLSIIQNDDFRNDSDETENLIVK